MRGTNNEKKIDRIPTTTSDRRPRKVAATAMLLGPQPSPSSHNCLTKSMNTPSTYDSSTYKSIQNRLFSTHSTVKSTTDPSKFEQKQGFPQGSKGSKSGKREGKDKNTLGTRFPNGSDFSIGLFLKRLSPRPSHEDFYKIIPTDLKRTGISSQDSLS